MKLQRLATSDGFATRGQLLHDDGTVCVPATLEPSPPDIPVGTYPARRYASPHFGYDLYRLYDVPGHDAIELHVGNLPADTHGCILLGRLFGTVYDPAGQPAGDGILASRLAFQRFMREMNGVAEFSLTVADPLPPSE